MSEEEIRNPYTTGRFWQAYATLYWPDIAQNVELARFAENIVTALPHLKPGEPLRILAVGFGFGGVELPIFRLLKQITGTALECVVIDKESEPLRFAEILLKDGIDSIPSTMAEMVSRIKEFPTKNQSVTERERWKCGPSVIPGGDSFHFVQDDLDWEPTIGESQNPICPELSHWNERLTEGRGESKKFHLVFVSFCLFHLNWWQRVIYGSLGLLEEQGILLHARVEGDEALFEGRSGRRTGKNTNATQIFVDGLFKDHRVTKTLETHRDASASRPFVVEEYLTRLEAFGLTRQKESNGNDYFKYAVTNSVGNSTYKDLLETRGFSTFRRIADQEKIPYDSLISEALGKATQGTTDQLEIDFLWSIHKASPRSLEGCPLHPHFQLDPCCGQSNKAITDSYITEYGLNGASSIYDELGEDHSVLACTIGEKLNQQALLEPDCLSVQFGFIPRGADRPDFFFTPNFSLPDARMRERQVRELCLYLSVINSSRQSKHLDKALSLSNTQTLLDVALKKFSKPCIFAYHLGANEFRISHRPTRDYEEIRFYVPCAPVDSRDELKSSLKTWMNSIKRKKFTPDDNREYPVVFKLFDFELPQKDTTEAIVRLFLRQYDLSAITRILHDQIDNIETLELETITALKETITDNSVFRSICLQYLTDTKLIIFYPAVYEVGGASSGRDLVIASYNRYLTDASVESEFHKFNQIFENVRFSRQEIAVANRTSRITSHESKKISTLLLNWLVKSGGEMGTPNLTVPPDSPWYDLVVKNEVALLPHSTMYRNVLKTHILWTMSGAVRDLPFDKPNTLEDMVSRCWNTVFIGFKAYVYQSLDALNPVGAAPYQPFLNALDRLFLDPPFLLKDKCETKLSMDWDNNDHRLVNLGRMFVCYFREYIQHADWTRPSEIEIESLDDNIYKFSICNYCQPDSDWRANREAELARDVGLSHTAQRAVFSSASAKREQQLVFDPDRTPYHGQHVIDYIASLLCDEDRGHLVKEDKDRNMYYLNFHFSSTALELDR